MSSFSGLTDASAALNAQRYGLDVTGQNIANSNTAGYTRQRADLAEVGPVPGVPSIYATQRTGNGVTVSGTSRLNDPVIDSRARAEHGRNGYLQAKSSTLSSVESLFNEPSDTGLSEQLSDFWNSWATVANNAADLPSRNVVIQKAAGLADTLNEASAALTRVTNGVSEQLTQASDQINSAATSLAQLNGAIAVASATGTNTNALADQRDVLLMKLSDLTGGTASIDATGQATMVVDGQNLVSGTTAAAFAVTAGNTLTVGGTAVTPAGGSAAAFSDALTTTLPSYAAKLDGVASALASTVNGAQTSGYDLNGNAGTAVFSGTTASTISVAVSDPSLLAASGQAGAANVDGSVALQLSAAGKLAAGPDVSYRQLVSTLGTEVQGTTQQASVQQSVTSTVDGLAESASGVSMDEETTNLLTYQRAYQASSRVLTTVDDMLDTLINRTGRVGL